MSSDTFDLELEEAMAEMLGAIKDNATEGIARSLRADEVDNSRTSSSTIGGKVAEPKPQNKCAICGSNADLKCRTCKSTCYCSSACQAIDWKLHKMMCSTLQNFETPPTLGMRRGILFRWNSEKPEFVWLKPLGTKADGKTTSLQLSELIGRSPLESLRIIANPVRNRSLVESGTTTMLFREATPKSFESMKQSMKRANMCLQTALGAGVLWLKDNLDSYENLLPPFPRVGNMVVMSMDSPKGLELRDATLADLRNIVDHFSAESRVENLQKMMEMFSASGLTNLTVPFFNVSLNDAASFMHSLKVDQKTDWPARARKLLGVRVTCIEDGDFTFKQLLFPRDHPFLLATTAFPPPADKSLPSGLDLPSAVKLPLAWIRHSVDSGLEGNPNAKPLKTTVSSVRDCLLAELLLEYRTVMPPPKKQMDFTFMRGDFNDLQIEHMQALCEFSREKLVPLLEGSFTKNDCLAVATKSAFEAYFKSCKEKNGWGQNVISPYAIGGVGCPDKPLELKPCSCKKRKLRCCHMTWMATAKK